MAQKYRKKPVEVEALQFFEADYVKDSLKYDDFNVKDKANLSEIWCNKTVQDGRYYIDTLEGNMNVSEGDYIIKGVQGECYPCKQDVFKKTYEKVYMVTKL